MNEQEARDLLMCKRPSTVQKIKPISNKIISLSSFSSFDFSFYVLNPDLWNLTSPTILIETQLTNNTLVLRLYTSSTHGA